MSLSPSSPAPTTAYVVKESRFSVRVSPMTYIWDNDEMRAFEFGESVPNQEHPRAAYTLADAWAVCDWLNNRAAP